MRNTVIFVKELKKTFKDKEVLKGVNVEVQRGEIFALLGSNGAGKTTTVNILSTLMKADSGEVVFADLTSNVNRLMSARTSA